MNDEWEMKRNLAQDVIAELFAAKQTGSIQLLLMQCALSAKQLDPDSWRKFIEHANSILNPTPGISESESAAVIAKLKEALRFYEREYIYPPRSSMAAHTTLAEDRGQKARAVLALTEPEKISGKKEPNSAGTPSPTEGE